MESLYIKKDLPKNHESEWDRIQRRRKAGLCKGGRFREWSRSGDETWVLTAERYSRGKKKIDKNI